MSDFTQRALALLMALTVFAPADAQEATDAALSAGSYTIPDQGQSAYSVTVTSVDDAQRLWVSAGRRMFNETWVLPTEAIGVWGLGPTFNEDSCTACHPNNGRARAPGHGEEVAKGLLMRLSIPGAGHEGAPKPHAAYGDQLQNRGVRNRVPSEGKAFVRYEPVTRTFADGESITLRRPVITFAELNFGELGEGTMVSPRIAPSLAGLGLLEAIPEDIILAIATQQSAQSMAGTPNYVWDIEKQTKTLGRFGWKANQPNLRQQIAAAFLGDIGATSELFPTENCPDVQTQCLTGPTATGCNGGRGNCQEKNFWEVLPSRLRNVTLYLQALGVPARRNVIDAAVRRGEGLFHQAQCNLCHIPELKTGPVAAIPSAANQIIRPFTDLLLHEMGEDLADHRPDYLANGMQWRTPPLWGLGLQKVVNGHTDLLHDGRARDFIEAIVWHGGQAQASRERVMQMSKQERSDLVRFLESL